ncbi:MAG: hypothetical protein ACLTTQ_03995 [Christensenellales bacterium]
MPKRKYGFNTVYISERLQESLRPISHCALSTIIAPMGYGKTTAADWYLEKKEDDGATVIRISVYSDNLAVFWRSVQEAFFHAGIDPAPPLPVDGSAACLSTISAMCSAASASAAYSSTIFICLPTVAPPISSADSRSGCRRTYIS